MTTLIALCAALVLIPGSLSRSSMEPGADRCHPPETVRVFIFAGQSNMVGSDSHADHIHRFPPFVGLDQPQEKIRFAYNLGREEKRTSKGWVPLQPVDNVVGPELSFARHVSREIKAPIAIIKCAAGGTTLGRDWNPDEPGGFQLYPLALQFIRTSLADLDRKKIPYRLEGFMWHQGENDMFEDAFRQDYGKNLANFLAKWRRDLNAQDLRFYIGELCTKTIWGMDNRDNMYAIRAGQMTVVDADPLATYVPTSHDAVEIGGGEGLHYHYGTLGQLQHGVNYAHAYLATLGKKPSVPRPLRTWPYPKGSTVRLFVLAGHRNMEGERAFTDDLKTLKGGQGLSKENPRIAYKYSLGGGYKVSEDWEPLGPAGFYDTFGPELSFGRSLQQKLSEPIAIAKFTHSGSQINDWTPKGTPTPDRNLYPHFLAFIRESMADLRARGHEVELAGIFYHLGENDMAFGPYRRRAAEWLQTTVAQIRSDLGTPSLKWFVSQQPPPTNDGLNPIDVTADLARLASQDPAFIHIRASDLPSEDEPLVLTARGIIKLGQLLAEAYCDRR